MEVNTGVLKLTPPPKRSKSQDFGGRFYSLQNPGKKNSALRAEGFILYKFLKIFPAFAREVLFFTKSWKFFARFAREVLFFTKSTVKIDLFLNVFWTVSALITAKTPKIFRALRAQGFGGPQKFSRASRGGFYSLQNPKIFSALRAGGFILYKIPKFFLPRFAREVLFFTKSRNFFTGWFHVGGGF